MDILVPTDKPRLPHPATFVGVARGMAIVGFVGYILLFSMVFSEGKVLFPHLRRTLELVALSGAGFLLSFRWLRTGGIILAAGMIVALLLTPVQLSEWRPWFFGLEGYMALTGTLFVLTPNRRD
jgi:hypothetical protein